VCIVKVILTLKEEHGSGHERSDNTKTMFQLLQLGGLQNVSNLYNFSYYERLLKLENERLGFAVYERTC